MNKVLIVIPYYYPGYRSGGPQQTILNVVEAYGDLFEFYIITKNHDLGAEDPYSEINEGWNNVGKAKVLYLNDRDFGFRTILRFSSKVDCVYACGLFEDTTIQTLIAHKSRKFKSELIVAPMGVFSENAYRQKNSKKRMFIYFCKIFGLFNDVMWSVTSNMEKVQAQKILGDKIKCFIASDIPCNPELIELHHKKKEIGKINIVFLSRICPKKNLLYAINVLKHIQGEIKFDIYGPKEDMKYWEKCKEELQDLDDNIIWNYCGEIKGKESLRIFSDYHIFLFPTLGENFGHVIFEALASGCIPIISNNTIWGDLSQNHCGEAIDLTNKEEFERAIQKFVDMDNDEFSNTSKKAKKYAQTKYKEILLNSGYPLLFNRL